MLKNLQKISTILILLTLVGCKTLTTAPAWPSDLPERQIFVDKYLSNRQVKTESPKVIEAHLSWIIRFYQGTVLYPNGWNRVSKRFLASIESPEDREEIAVRIRSLGILIANEWAQDNDVRRINSSHVATWGSALRTSAEQNDQKNYITKVERDVNALIDGTVKSSEISYERYYQSEDYDNF